MGPSLSIEYSYLQYRYLYSKICPIVTSTEHLRSDAAFQRREVMGKALHIKSANKRVFLDKVREALPKEGNLNLCLTCGASMAGLESRCSPRTANPLMTLIRSCSVQLRTQPPAFQNQFLNSYSDRLFLSMAG